MSVRASAIGLAHPRLDGAGKVRGTTRYAGDLRIPGLLHARLVTALDVHGRMTSIDVDDALAVRGVVRVLTARDLPIRAAGDTRMVEPLAREEVVFAGQPVALVVAESEEAAEEAASLVAISVDPLPAVLDPEAALVEGAPQARLERQRAGGGSGGSQHAAVGGGDRESQPLSTNALGQHAYSQGDVDAALSSCAAVATGTFATSWVYQAPLEAQVALAWLEPDGQLVVQTSTQAIFQTQQELARLFELPLPQVRVVPTPLGGAFGAKYMLVEPIVAGAALVLGRPIRLAFTRSEDISSANPAPSARIELALGADQPGRFQALRARIVLDAGAFPDNAIEGIAAVVIGGPYRWPTFDVQAFGTLTNRFGTGAYRAPGGPQTAFALESLIDDLAARLNIDPLELRRQNLAREEDAMIDGSPWPRMGSRECIDALAGHPLWRGRDELPPDEGIGAAIAFWPGAKETASAVCRLDADGGLTVLTGVVDMSGAASGFAHIAAAVFGTDISQIRLVTGDTATAPRAPASGGSVITFSAGRAVALAVEDARKQLLEIASGELEIAAEDLELVDGVVRARGAPQASIDVAELAARVASWDSPHPPVEGRGVFRPSALAPSVAGHLAHVRVDRGTGAVAVLQVVAVQDAGCVLNPALVDGQMRGGTTQGLGWALWEELIHDEDGNLVTTSFQSYAVPKAPDVPNIETIHVEVPTSEGPFGAKGVGEASVISPAPAVANAVAAAVSVRIRELPITPPKLLRALTRSPN